MTPKPPLAESILMVCAANVCRSPLAELELRRALAPDPAISVSSAGVRADAGGAVCILVHAFHPDTAWREQSEAHRSAGVDVEMIERSAIVLAASREIRGELVRLAPRARNRIFTIREAAQLGAGFSSSAATGRVAAYVAHLDRARSRALPSDARTGLIPRLRRLLIARDAGDGISIADRHGSRGHGLTITDVVTAVTTIAGQLERHRPVS